MTFLREGNSKMTGTGGSGVTVRVNGDGSPSVRGEGVPDTVVSVLFGTGLEEWRRGWRGPGRSPPDREAVVVASDVARSATAASQTRAVADRGLAYTVLGTATDTARILDAVRETIDGVTNPTVLVDDIAPLAVRRDAGTAVEMVEALGTAAADTGGSLAVGCAVVPAVEPVLSSLAAAGNVVGADAEVAAAVDRLRDRDPTTFGYLRRHWTEARRGIESCSRNYPQSKQVHAALSDPETTPRTLGATLSGLVSLGVLDTWGETVGPTRYDVTAYDPDRLTAVGIALATAAADGR